MESMTAKGPRAASYWKPYLLLVAAAFLLAGVLRALPGAAAAFQKVPEGLYLSLGVLFLTGYALNYFAPRTVIPSFVWAILFGVALQPAFALFTENGEALLIVVELLAAFVLFAGGVEVPFKNFTRYLAPIANISLVGTLLTVLLFALALELFVPFFGFSVPAITLLLTAAILSSIDPTALLPTFKSLSLKKPFLRDIALSESAVNDVAGTIVTRFFLVGALAAAGAGSVLVEFSPLLSRGVLESIALEIAWGVATGVFGAWLLGRWSDSLARSKRHWSDPALFFSVPVLMFALGSLVGGSGFLAAFVAGLLYDGRHATKEVRAFFETFVDSFIKPVIFVLLGAVVPLSALAATAAIGAVAAVVFMFFVRPLVVFISLLPWMVRDEAVFTWRELMFLSFIRETGAIPAILMLVALASGVAGSEFIFAVGMWVILYTLLIEPPLTPYVARRLALVRA